MKPTVLFTEDDVDEACADWGCNCGPAALCAALGLTPEAVRPLLVGFDGKRYTNPTMMNSALVAAGAQFRLTYRGDVPRDLPASMRNGLIRVQWSGRWTSAGVPMRVRYRETHWIAMRGAWVFDVNAMSVGGWISRDEWILELAPWLIRNCCPKGDGGFWPTHCLEVQAK